MSGTAATSGDRAGGAGFACWCGEREARPVLRGEGFAIVRCRRCGACRTEPPPLEQPEATARIIEGHREHEKLFRGILAEVLAEVLRVRSGGRLLDVGCSVGHLMALAAERGFEVHGIETHPLAAGYARERFGDGVSSAPIEETPFPAGTFDVVTANSVLEHVPRPVEFLAAARRLLRPDGIVVLGVPNFGGWASRLEGAAWYGLQPLGHVWQFTPASLADVCRQAGLEPLRVRTNQLHRKYRSAWRSRLKKALYDGFERLGRGDGLLLTAARERRDPGRGDASAASPCPRDAE